MDHSKKRDYRARKFASAHRYQGRRRKPKRKATGEECESPASRPNQGRGDTAACGNFDEIDAAIKFVSASERKIKQFENDRTRSVAGSVNGVICDVGALTAMVSRAVCPTCRTAGLVRDAVSKRKGLSSFLELYCDNSECPESVLSAAHSSRRVVREGDLIGAGEDQDRSYRSGSSRDNFAVNVKVVVAARAIGIGHEQLSRFCAILGLPTPMHHKTFIAIGKKVRAAAVKAVQENLAKARIITKENSGGADVAVLYDGTVGSKSLRDLECVAERRKTALPRPLPQARPMSRLMALPGQSFLAHACLFFDISHDSSLGCPGCAFDLRYRRSEVTATRVCGLLDDRRSSQA
ncbi:hypothetical protein HPB50_019947 [Hyalomma asiaticum]|uniref:Uncharacterized protein n=1 Tax=Hyalomma asiaticum TaxID=266040 RepID=A0ACB7T2H9_HYAAI|nr:hypothetical protein HPB50_019947 [Hyalomma asiaticum]